MRLALLELPARFGDPEQVFAELETLLADGPCDLALVPECALTGYVDARGDFDLTRFAEPKDGPAAKRLAALASRFGVHLVAPLVERVGDRLFNTSVVLDPSGAEIARYRKRHPWPPEARAWATPGDLPHPLFGVAGVTFTIAVCFDVHFLAREIPDTLAAVDVLLFPSAWVDDGRADLRGPLFDGLRKRFGVAVANANWGDGEPPVRGQGRSRFVAADGKIVELPLAQGPARLDVEVVPRTRSAPPDEPTLG